MLARKINGAWAFWSGRNELVTNPSNGLDQRRITAAVVEQLWSDEELAQYALARVVSFVVPEGKRRTGAPRVVDVEGVPHEEFDVEDIRQPGPADLPLNNWRFHWMIGKLGWDATIRGAIGQIADEDVRSITLARYEKSAEYNRDDAALNQIAGAMQIPAETLDAAWMTAATVAV